jgi:3'-phosphoadenosine 5'-phosphosulfate (PAPS) 3'-phosphatase
MTSSQSHPSLDLISPMQAMAREAGSLLMDYFRQHVKIEYKGGVDLVTVADRKSEALILERIRGQFPTHDGMSIRSTAQLILRMVIRYFAFRWRSSTGGSGSRGLFMIRPATRCSRPNWVAARG